MTTARRLLVFSAVALAAAVMGMQFVAQSDPGRSGHPSEGVLAPLVSSLATPWVEVARLASDQQGRGGIVHLDSRRDTLIILQRHQWYVLADGTLSGPYGSTGRGAPGWIAAGAGIAALPGGVAILDRARQEVSRWDLNGNVLDARSVRHADSESLTFPEALSADVHGRVLVSLRTMKQDGSGEWLVIRFHADWQRADTVYRAPTDGYASAAHNTPHMAQGDGGSFSIVPAVEWRFLDFTTDGALSSDVNRPDGPRWAVPDSVRRSYAAVLQRVPPAQRASLALPPSFPPVRSVAAGPDGSRVVLVAAGADAVHAEVLSADAVAIGRLWEVAERNPVFAADGAVFRVRETLDYTVIERQQVIGTD